MRAIQILEVHLRANGFDGLVMPDAECGCLVDDLCPCGGDFANCEAGYKHPGPTAEFPFDDWVMKTTKPQPKEIIKETKDAD